MHNSEIVNKILFDWETLSRQEMDDYIRMLSPKLLRWLGENHPDSRTRKLFFLATNVTLADSCMINRGFVVSDDYEPLLFIGERVAIAPNVTVVCVSNPNNSRLQGESCVRDKLIVKKPVRIEADAWIGANVVLLPGVTIGQGAIIGAGAVVAADADSYGVYAGVPARKLRTLDIERQRDAGASGS